MFVCNRRDIYYSITTGSRQGSMSLLSPTPPPVLSYHQHRTLVCLFWSGTLHYTVLTHQRIPLLLAKRVLWAAWWIQQLKLLFLWYLSIPGFLQSDHTVRQAQCGRWFTVKHSKAGLQTSSHPQNSATHLLGLQGLQQTQANQANVKSNLTGMDTELQVRFCLKVVFQILRLGNFWHYNQF